MTRHRPSRVLRGLAALVLLALLVLGVPAALLAVSGSPIPHALPTVHQVMVTLSQRDTGALLTGAVRLLAWLSWAAFTLSVAVEATAAARRRPAPRLAGIGGVQHLAGGLVAAVMVAFPAGGAAMAAAVPAVAPTTAPAASTQTLTAGTTAPARAVATVTVRPGDCLWTIARHYLGSGDRYGEIAALNQGHAMGDGQRFTSPSLIRPGWVLRMPAGPARPGHPGPAPARHHPGHPSRHPPFAAGHHGAAPSSPAPAPQGGDPAPVASGTAAASASGSHAARPAASPASELAIFTAGLFTGGILTTLRTLRHRQRQNRRPGRRIALPDTPAARRTEANLRAAAATPGVTTGPAVLRAALAALAGGLRDTGQPLPPAAAVHLAPDGLEILLATPAPTAPPPFTVSPGTSDQCWRAGADTLASLPHPPGDGSGAVLPGLVTAGRMAGGGLLLIDLEAGGATAIAGDPGLADQMLVTAALELTTNPWAGGFDLILCGFPELAALSGRAQGCDTLDGAIGVLEARAAQLAAAPGAGPARENRLADPASPDWDLTLLVTRNAPDAAQLARIMAAAGPGSGIAALTAAPAGHPAPDGAARIDVSPDPARPGGALATLHPMALTVAAQLPDPGTYAAICEIFAATRRADVDADDPPYDTLTTPAGTAAGATLTVLPESSPADPAATWPAGPGTETAGVAITILGPFGLSGTVSELQPKQAELVLALALAGPPGLANSALCTMLGANEDSPKPPDSLRQIITRTRRKLGLTPAGAEYIVHDRSGRYVLDPAARLDWTTFRELAESGREDLDRARLREAIRMLRGQPLDGVYHWWVGPELHEAIRAEITDTAQALAQLELSAGDPAAAARAARAGLEADGSAEPLWRALMQAEDAAGNTAGVHAAWQHCLDAVAGIAVDGEPHPDTRALYHELTRNRMAAAGSR